MLAIVPSQLEVLAKTLKNFLPKSLFVYNFTKLAEENLHIPGSRPRAVVDSWPDFKYLICSYLEPSESKNSKTKTPWHTFTYFKNDPDISDDKNFILEAAKKWNLLAKPCRFYVFQESAPSFASVFNEYGKLENVEGTNFKARFNYYWVPPENSEYVAETAQNANFVHGLRLEDKVKDYDATFINTVWAHKHPGSDEIIRQRIRHFPSVCFTPRPSEGELPVALMLGHPLGLMSHSYVCPQWRGKNLMGKVLHLQAKNYLDRGWHPFGMVQTTNMAMKKCIQKSGFLTFCDDFVEWYKFIPVVVQK